MLVFHFFPSIFESIIMLYLFSMFAKFKFQSKFVLLIPIISAYIIEYIIEICKIVDLKVFIISFSLDLLIVNIFYRVDKRFSVILTGGFALLSISTSAIALLLSSIYLGLPLNYFDTFSDHHLITTILYLALLMVCVYVAEKFRVINKFFLPLKYWITLMTVPIFSAAWIFFSYPINSDTPMNTLSKEMYLQNAVLILTINFMFMLVYRYIVRNLQLHYAYKGLMIAKESAEDSFNKLYRSDEKQRDFMHDIARQLRILGTLITGGQADKALDMVRGLSGEIENTRIKKFTGNQVIDFLISRIPSDIQVVVDGVLPRNIFVSDGDIGHLLGNAIDNAVKACNGKEGAYIYFDFKYTQDVFEYMVVNPDIPPYPRGGAGRGQEIMRIAASKYRGHIDFIEDNENYKVVVILYNQAKE